MWLVIRDLAPTLVLDTVRGTLGSKVLCHSNGESFFFLDEKTLLRDSELDRSWVGRQIGKGPLINSQDD